MPSPQPRIVSISLGTILKTIALLIGIAILWQIRDIVLYMFSAMLLAGLIYPAAQWGTKHKIPKGLTVVVVYLLLFGLLALGFALLIPALFEEARMLAGTYGKSLGWLADGASGLRTLTERYGLSDNLQSSVQGIETQLQNAVSGVLGTLTDFFGGIVGFVIVMVLSFYVVVEDEALKNLFRNVVPHDYRELASQLLSRMMEKLGGWLRGQLVLGLIISILYFIGFSIVGVPYALLLAILGGFLEFIPYLGPIIAAIPAVFLAFSISPARAVITLLLILVIQQMEGHILIPKVMQKAVGLNPIISIVAFLVGARLFGIAGAIFAIPVATALSVLLVEILRFRREQGV